MILSAILAAIIIVVTIVSKPWKKDKMENQTVSDKFLLETLEGHLPNYYKSDIAAVWRDIWDLITISYPEGGKTYIKIPIYLIEGALSDKNIEAHKESTFVPKPGPADRLEEFPEKEKFFQKLRKGEK